MLGDGDVPKGLGCRVLWWCTEIVTTCSVMEDIADVPPQSILTSVLGPEELVLPPV